jgi:hypothetical protein
MVKHAIFRFIRQVRLQYWLNHDPAALRTVVGNDYIPGLYGKVQLESASYHRWKHRTRNDSFCEPD